MYTPACCALTFGLKKKNRHFAHKDKVKTEQTRKVALGLTGSSESKCAGHVSGAGVTDRYMTRITDYDTMICVAICGMRLDQLIAALCHFLKSRHVKTHIV